MFSTLFPGFRNIRLNDGIQIFDFLHRKFDIIIILHFAETILKDFHKSTDISFITTCIPLLLFVMDNQPFYQAADMNIEPYLDFIRDHTGI